LKICAGVFSGFSLFGAALAEGAALALELAPADAEPDGEASGVALPGAEPLAAADPEGSGFASGGGATAWTPAKK